MDRFPAREVANLGPAAEPWNHDRRFRIRTADGWEQMVRTDLLGEIVVSLFVSK
jgi:hypothetical protein